MRVLVDVDGVLAVFTDPILEAVGSKYRNDDVLGWDFFKDLMTEEERVAAFKILDGPEFWRTLPKMPGASEGIIALRGFGHEVLYVTSPWQSCATWYGQRRDWLRGNGFLESDRQLVVSTRKDIIQADVLIDDRTDHVLDYEEANPNAMAILFDQPYNRGAVVRRRARWPKIVELMR